MASEMYANIWNNRDLKDGKQHFINNNNWLKVNQLLEASTHKNAWKIYGIIPKHNMHGSMDQANTNRIHKNNLRDCCELSKIKSITHIIRYDKHRVIKHLVKFIELPWNTRCIGQTNMNRIRKNNIRDWCELWKQRKTSPTLWYITSIES